MSPFVKDKKYKEVANLLDISDKSVEYHMGQAFKILRQVINKYEEFDKSAIHLQRLAGIALCLMSLDYLLI